MKKYYYSALLGNLLENYDKALYFLLASILSPLFFTNFDPITALMILFLPLGFLSKPLGALLFGFIGDRFGRKKALFFTIIGMSIATASMGFLPTYEKIGPLAPILLVACRMLQSFFSAGETTGGALLILENPSTKNKELASSLYDAVGIAGYFLASLVVFSFSAFDLLESNWRFLCILGSLSGLITFSIRVNCLETLPETKEKISWKLLSQKAKRPLLSITLVSAFAYSMYALSINFMNSFLPYITSLTMTEILGMNTLLSVLDMFLLPLFGYLALKFSKEKMMTIAIGAALFAMMPLFLFLQNATFITAAVIRIAFVLIGVAFSAPYYEWAKQTSPPECRYTVISLGKAIGGGFIGYATTSISLWLYQKSGWVVMPALYIMALAILALGGDPNGSEKGRGLAKFLVAQKIFLCTSSHTTCHKKTDSSDR